ncbi:hypothetical protein MOUN0_L04654 [Monosporozyma unispora]|nr:target of Sbf [Kazachstania unispora]
MKFNSVKTLSVLTSLATLINADCQLSGDGNYYCSSTDAIVYSNVGISGSYNDVTSMDETSCACSSQPIQFSGNLAPLDEELSVHFRGPLNLKQFGVYYPNQGTALKKRDGDMANENCAETVSKKKHRHKRDVAVEYVEVTATVYVNEAGETVTATAPATNTATGASTVAANNNNNNEVSAAQTSTQNNNINNNANNDGTSQKRDATTSLTAASPSSSLTSSNSYSNGDWTRMTYFTPGSATNCTFMNHQGGTAGSGTWSGCFGNSISYAASNGVDGAGSAFALDDVTLKSGQEYMIFSGTECSGPNGDCGYYREGIPAYHGFGGSSKIFVFEFEMPTDNDGSGYNQDMPAIWLLNAKIPRTLQYGNAACSCWETGCGEMDLFEILSAGSDKLISHVHDGQGGGTQDYFVRPVGNTLKAAVIFNGDDKSIHIVQVNDDFSGSLSQATVNSWLNTPGSAAALP